MNYQELASMAPYQPWAATYKAEIDADNEAILAHRQSLLDARHAIGVGDLVIAGDKTYRVAHDWGDSVQFTDGRFGASFYFGEGYVDFSGGLDPSIQKLCFTSTEERRAAPVWFFSQGFVRAHNGYHTEAMFRVWRLIA